ncbi:hypothetical protein [Streptomyces sp. 7N604]|uniref:hypothetical protein n=1 Tax=Streptomyces sp. 7N604 TaxID=3457415 RepID=UPI003FD48C22
MDIAARRRKRTALAVAQRRVSAEVAADWSPLPEWLTVGALVTDSKTGHKGEVQPWPYYFDCAPTHAWLRPVGGGREWTAEIANLRPAEDQGGT